jgi:hypothetical protein
MENNITTKLNIYVFCCIICICYSGAYNATDERTLFENLFRGYLNYVIPRENSSIPLNVTVKPSILLIDQVDVKRQTFTARIFFELTWIDKFLSWDPERYSGIGKIHVPYSMIWTPDVCIAGDLGDYTNIGKDGTIAVVHNNGYVIFWPIRMFEITCVVEIQKYPFDEHSCEIDISSWTFDSKFIKMVAGEDSIDVGMLTPSGEWEVKTEFAFYNTIEYGSLGFSHVIFPFRLRRRWQFIILNTFFPTLCTSLLSLLCFCLPNESGERVGLSISIFLTLAVFMTVTSRDLPETANSVSLLGAYVALQLAWSGITIILTVVSLVIACKDNSQPIPKWLQALVRCRRINNNPNSIKTCDYDTVPMNNSMIGDAMQEQSTWVNIYSTWSDVAKSFNTLCFYGSFICQICLHVWFLISSVL